MDTTDNGWVTAAYVLGNASVEIRVTNGLLSHPAWAYNWRVWIVGTGTTMHGSHSADTEATAYRLACECAAAEARARLGTEAAAPIVAALNTFLWQKTHLSLFDAS